MDRKICVYAICKNEEKFVDRWYESVKDADGIFVLDTGSTDNTVKKLQDHNVVVKSEIIKPWRFDVARNRSLEIIPDDFDICVCLDLDEVLEKNWKENILKAWTSETDQLRYIYNWFIDEDNIPRITFYADKIHRRHGFKWINPVHEVLKYEKKVNQVYTDNVIINHFPDHNKSRSNYLPLLELAIKEDPFNDRNMHYLGREYMYYQRWNEAIDTLIAHLNLKTASWKDERCASMRFISRCYKALNRFDEAKMWLEKACKEAPYLKDPWAESAIFYYQLKDYDKTIKNIKKALDIGENPKTYINEIFSSNECLYDLLSLTYFHKGDLENAIISAQKGLNINPKNERLRHNLNIFLDNKKVEE